jgi:hypothetical protein
MLNHEKFMPIFAPVYQINSSPIYCPQMSIRSVNKNAMVDLTGRIFM